MKLYECRRCGRFCLRGTKVCWNCGVQWPGMSGWVSLPLRLLVNRFSLALPVVLLGAVFLYRVLPPTEKERLTRQDLENSPLAVTLKGRAVDENGAELNGGGLSGNPNIETKQEPLEEKTGAKESAVKEQSLPVEEFKETNRERLAIDSWSIQVAAFRDEKDADSLAIRLEKKGYKTHVESGRRWHRVLVGEFVSLKEAERVKNVLSGDHGFDDALLTQD